MRSMSFGIFLRWIRKGEFNEGMGRLRGIEGRGEVGVEREMLTMGENREYAFYMEGWDTEQPYAMHMLDNGTSEWFSITRWTPPQKTELRRDQVWVS